MFAISTKPLQENKSRQFPNLFEFFHNKLSTISLTMKTKKLVIRIQSKIFLVENQFNKHYAMEPNGQMWWQISLDGT